MADNSTTMSQAEIAILKETLGAQQRLLQKLYNELEAEREASATAASEALSVILRLQGEKAAVKMEAEQYKRLAEEKMIHAEESFAVIEDIITQKEMEMAELDYQLQTYKYQLMGMGVIDPSDGDADIPENLLQRKEYLARMNSAPLLVKYKKASNSCSPELDYASKNVDEQEISELAPDSDRRTDCSTHGGISSYADQIRELELRVREIAGPNYVSSRHETSPSLSSRPSVGNLSMLSNLMHDTRPPSPQINIGSSYDRSKAACIVNGVKQTKFLAGETPKNGEVVDIPWSSSVHDVFEVPQADEDFMSNESLRKSKKETAFNEVVKSKDCSFPEAVKPYYAKYEPEWLKKLLHPNQHEKKLSKLGGDDKNRAIVKPTTSASESQSIWSKLKRTSSEITEEVERVAESAARRVEELKLLTEIREKLNVLQDEIRSQKAKESSSMQEDKPSLTPISEAMLHFWL